MQPRKHNLTMTIPWDLLPQINYCVQFVCQMQTSNPPPTSVMWGKGPIRTTRALYKGAALQCLGSCHCWWQGHPPSSGNFTMCGLPFYAGQTPWRRCEHPHTWPYHTTSADSFILMGGGGGDLRKCLCRYNCVAGRSNRTGDLWVGNPAWWVDPSPRAHPISMVGFRQVRNKFNIPTYTRCVPNH